jgi:hypothetical protein
LVITKSNGFYYFSLRGGEGGVVVRGREKREGEQRRARKGIRRGPGQGEERY